MRDAQARGVALWRILWGGSPLEAGRRSVPALMQGVDFVTDALAAVQVKGGLLGASFWAFVVAPTVCFWLYAAIWQSERFVAETRMTLREAQSREPPKGAEAASIISKLSGGAASRDAQNAYMVLAYVKSRAVIQDLGGRSYFEPVFAKPVIDYFSRLDRDATLEDAWKYWLSRISASVENISGILTLRVEAFRPDEAQKIASDLVRLSEDLVNKMTVRNRADSLARAENEVVAARERLARAREKTLEFRNSNALIDPGARATSLGELIGKLTLERIDLVNALSTVSSSLAADAPSQRLQRTRLAAVEKQIAELRKKLTDDQGAGAVSEQIATYESLKLDEQFAERLYSIANSAYENARQDLERQQLYLVTIVPPTLPEAATYPRAAANTALLFSSLLIAWAIISLLVASIEDQMT
ncbi:MAG: hypothetical protein ACR652_18100 [Methylocystis sp.]|uniref:hypothetical protein n=1 Tax=Methylocystis sp. TaxID=1911079 RepID=UPI003DA2B143